MNEAFLYGIGALLICFTAGTFFLSRIQTDVYPEDYEFKLDPFWYVFGLLFVSGLLIFHFLPVYYDTVKDYGYTDFTVSFALAALLYFSYLLDVSWLTWAITTGASLLISFMQPDDFRLFPEYLSPTEDKIAVAAILIAISKGLGLMIGLAAFASMQFITVMAVSAIFAYFGILPQLTGALALAYAGVMLAFAFLSWPPEKLVMSDGAFASLGFILGCFMLNAAIEFSEASMFIAVSYMAVEIGIALYNRIIKRNREERAFMYTSYYRLSENGVYEPAVVYSVLKIFIVDAVLALIQMAAHERLALPVFATAINLWFLSILSGDTKPEELLSFSRWSKNTVKGILDKKGENKKKKRQKEN